MREELEVTDRQTFHFPLCTRQNFSFVIFITPPLALLGEDKYHITTQIYYIRVLSWLGWCYENPSNPDSSNF